ncbi:MAG: hypothetical protein ABDH49_04175 [Candidatus Hydrothermales bacterium]
MREKYWVLHYLSGAFLFFLLLSHILIMHFYKILERLGFYQNPLDWEKVVERASNVTLTFIYILFLMFALFHGFYGLKNILSETGFGKKYKKHIVIFLWFLGLILFFYGTFTTVKAGGIR